MLIKLPEALSASNSSRRGKKGLSLHNTLCDIGKELNANLTEINSNIPTEYSDAIRQLQNKDGFILQAYINSYISGDALNRKCASTLQSLRYFVPTISERRVFPKYCIKRENQCRSRAAAEIQSDEAVEG